MTIPQLNAIAFLIRKLINHVNPLERYQKYSLKYSLEKMEQEGVESKMISMRAEADWLYAEIEEKGLESVYAIFFTECGRWMDLPRKYEVLAVLSRMRMIQK